ncbi:GAF domain-containing protein [Flavobacteriaceae bacterium R38]|nr:GAF domain-containing protein [Flavobacteriaceae bacterium R38]
MPKTNQNPVLHRDHSKDNFSDVLVYFSESLQGINNEDDILWDLAKNCISKLGFVDCVVYLLDSERDVLIQKAAYGPKNPKDFEIHEPVERPLGYGIVGHVGKSGKAELIHDTSKDERYRVDDEFRLSEVCVPIIIDKKVIGIIDCEHPEKHFFSEHHLQILLTMSSICAIKIKSVRDQKMLVEKQNNLFKLKEEMMELRLKALNSQLNPHFIFNALNAIQYFITSENKKLALEFLSSFSKLIRFYLSNIEKDTVFLKDEIAMLKQYLKLQKLRYNDQFDYNISFIEVANTKEAKVPSFVIHTLFENIIENAIYNQYKNHHIQVTFELCDKNVCLTVNYSYDTDDTVTYTPEYREHIIKWQNQIRLLNKAKGYNIKKKVLFNKKKKFNEGIITLKLPNLR